MRRALVLILVAACGGAPVAEQPDAAIAETPDGSTDVVAATGFGELSGACGSLMATDLTSASPALFRATLTFARRFNDPGDRPLLTPGGQHLAATPNAGGSSGLSEIFAYEELARCETATLLHTETEISYQIDGKITDLEVSIAGERIGVSVTRAQTYPLGTPYTQAGATTLLNKKLRDIQMSTANVSEDDKWRKQVLAILAWDTQAADTFATAWAALDADVKADTLVVITTTEGDDTFIYTNQ
jgi:hypothetical protein